MTAPPGARRLADGSSWSAVIEHLQADGYHVTAPQFPVTSTPNVVALLMREQVEGSA
jgi:hypothetical protein